MALQPKSQIRSVTGIKKEEKEAIMNFLQGAVYCWCKNRPDEWFSLRELMGGENFDWNGTPLIVLYEKHIAKGKKGKEAIKAAAIDAGWLLKEVLDKDKRIFEHKEEQQTRKYRWLRQNS